MREKGKIWIISIALAAFSFVIVYDTLCVLIKDNPVELSAALEEESSSKTEKEKEKECDEMDEVFMEYFFLSVASQSVSLHYSIPFPSGNNYSDDFISEIVPPPPKA
jgi:hypothetical protein